MPVLADDAEQHAGIGPVPVERGQAVGGVFGYFPGFDAFDRSADPDGLLSSVEIAAAVPFGGRQVDRVAAAPFDAAVLLVERLAAVVRLACPVDVLQVLENGFLVALDGGDEVVRRGNPRPGFGRFPAGRAWRRGPRRVPAVRFPPPFRTAGISFVFSGICVCPSTRPLPCSTAATIMRRSVSICFDAQRTSLPSRATGRQPSRAQWAAQSRSARSRASGGRFEKM